MVFAPWTNALDNNGTFCYKSRSEIELTDDVDADDFSILPVSCPLLFTACLCRLFTSHCGAKIRNDQSLFFVATNRCKSLDWPKRSGIIS